MTLPGNPKKIKRKEFREGLICFRPGCTRRARHQWGSPCALTINVDESPIWIALCDECDMEMNRAALKALGVPKDVREELLEAYRMVQGDGAWD